MNIEVDTVYGASRFEQKVTRAPASVSIITADDIRHYGYRTLADILSGVRDFYISNDRNYSYIGSRGFSRPGDYNSRFLLMIDGHRLNDSIYEQAAIGSDFPLDVDLIDRVEVIRGASSSLYGTNAFLGVIHVLTKKGGRVGGVELSGETGSQYTFKGRLTYGGRFEDRNTEVLFSATKYRSKGNRELFYPEFNSPETSYGTVQGGDGEAYGNAFLNLSNGFLNLQGAFLSREKDIPTAAWGTVFNQAGTKSIDDRGYADLRFDRTFDNGLGVLARLYYDHYRYDGDYVFPYLLNRDQAIGQSWGGELKATKVLFDRHRLVAGVEYTDYFRQDQLNWDENPRIEYLNDQRSTYQWAAYLQGEVTLLPELILNLGVRYDHYGTFGDTVNPRLALIYALRETTHLKLLYGESFRAPSVYELYYSDGNVASKANPDLQPEKIASYEFVLEQYFPRDIKMTGSLFRNTIRNLIVLQTDPSDGLLVFRNVDKMETAGIGLEFEKRWSSGIRGRIAYTYQESENKLDGTVPVASPRHLAKMRVLIPFLDERLTLSLEEQYVDSRRTIGGTDAAPYFLTNVTLLGRGWIPGLEGSVSVYNVFDKRYEDPASQEHVQNTITRDGREFRFKLTYRF
ncbi:MAG: TonB-dependent receptor [Syntrophaceae bacterium]|nr:TonB-dependent receptor [Syntrophaceae bacterium]